MKNLFKLWLILLFGAVLGILIQDGNGYVLIAASGYTIELSLALALGLIALLFVGLYFMLRFSIRAYHLPSDLRYWRHQRSARLAQTAMNKGLLEMSAGRWRKAERSLLKYGGQMEIPLSHYLAAARAAQLQGAHDRRDAYIRLAYENMPAAQVIVGLTQAELQMADHQQEQALATLQHLRQVAPQQTYVLRLLRRLYEQLGDWESLRELIPALRRHKVEKTEALNQLEIITYRRLLQAAHRADDADMLTGIWHDMPKVLQADSEIIIEYVGYLQECRHHVGAETLLRQALRQDWHTPLVELYGLMEFPEPGAPLLWLEKFLDDHPDDPVLLLALGRLSMRARLWGKARSYLEASIAGDNPPLAAYRELGRLLEHMGEGEIAMRLYRKALNIDHRQSQIPLPKDIGSNPLNRPLVDEQPVLASLPYQQPQAQCQ